MVMPHPGAGTAPAASPPLLYRVVGRVPETPDAATLTVEPVDAALPPFLPGQFAMVHGFPVGDIPLSVSRLDGTRLSHTVRAVGAVSRSLHGTSPGSAVGVRGPYGKGWDLAAAEGHDVLVVAGGIGLAPVRPLITEVLAEPHRYGRMSVLIGARTPVDLLYAREADEWREAGAAVHITVDRPDDGWRGDVGVVTNLLPRASIDPAGTAVFLCGPEVMMRAVARELTSHGVPPVRVQVSLERTMHCGTGHCGHCQLGPLLLCRDGPVVPWKTAEPLLTVREL